MLFKKGSLKRRFGDYKEHCKLYHRNLTVSGFFEYCRDCRAREKWHT